MSDRRLTPVPDDDGAEKSAKAELYAALANLVYVVIMLGAVVTIPFVIWVWRVAL